MNSTTGVEGVAAVAVAPVAAGAAATAGTAGLSGARAWRASLLWFAPGAQASGAGGRGGPGQACFEQDGLLVTAPNAHGVQVVQAIGSWQALHQQYADLVPEHLPGRIIAPGFVDLHVHFPQTNVIGSPAAGLLPWLENYTFPEEMRFRDAAYAEQSAAFFVDELLRNGVTTALAFATSHPHSVSALFAQAAQKRMRMVSGLVLMDRHAPEGLLHPSEQSLRDTESLIQRWHGQGRLGYAITPRFAPTSTEAQLRGAGELAAQYPDVWIQSHVAENTDEIAWARQLFPAARSYLSIYNDCGLMRQRAVYAHCIHLDDADRALLRDTATSAAVCPTSNLFLGSGFFDYAGADRAAFRYGLASDVGGGTSFSPFHTMLAAYQVGRTAVRGLQTKAGVSLSPQHLWWQHTAGAGAVLAVTNPAGQSMVGNLLPGCEADLVVLNPQATPLLARKTALANNLDELLFSMIVLGDDRVVERTVIA